MDKKKSDLNRLRDFAPFVWFLPLHLEFEVKVPMGECLQVMNSNFNVKNQTTLRYREPNDQEVAFTISRRYERTSLDCTGSLRQYGEGQTQVHIDMGNDFPIMELVLGIPLSLLFIIAHTTFMFFLVWFAILYSARRNYQTQHALADDLVNTIWRRWK